VERKQKIYWFCQVGGWLFYWILNLIFFELSNTTSARDILTYFLFLLTGIVLTHADRFVILKFEILRSKVILQLFYLVISSFVLAVLFLIVGSLHGVTKVSLENALNAIVPFLFWSLIYFGFHFLENYKRTEIQNLRWEATSKDIELNKLKSQLNPHFMFNSMNSIRALIDEDPSKAKEAVTKLSNILRNSLLINKNKEIPLEEELKIVHDYLDLEHIRYEERLQYQFNVDKETLTKNVPPLIVQSQVENAIKHGISKLPSGGKVQVNAKINGDKLNLEIINTGQMSNGPTETGFGLSNSKQRLELLYGAKAEITISNNSNNEVEVKINIPI
jgi:two-component system, LytTR family, sensor kinase